MEAIVTAQNLVKSYGRKEAVSGISFTIYRKETFGFLGPNGAGKTTALKLIHCILPKTSGSLKVFGQEAAITSREIKKRIGVVPQENSLDPELTVEENLWVYGLYFSLPRSFLRKKIQELLAFLSLEKEKKKPIRKLSGGEQRRLVLARALISDPELFILDEPTTGLDPAARHLIWARLKALKKQGKTLILTTHYMEEAAHLCDRVALMNAGKILFTGNPQEVVQEQLGPTTLQLLPEEKDRKDLQFFLKKQGISFSCRDHFFLIFPRSETLLTALQENFSFQEWHQRPANLEDLFLYLSGHTLS